MKQYMLSFVTAALLASALAPAGMAQAVAKPLTALKVQVVISRYEGDKKVSSLPYTMAVTSNDRGVSLRMGSQVPIPSNGGGFSYQNVGTNIDCTATSTDEARFNLHITISDSSVLERRLDSPPTLRNFNTDNSVVLRDGQSTQFTAATDKITGEVVKVEVTLTVEK